MTDADYQRYLDELESNYLEVVLIPSGDHECAMRGGMVRAVQSQNTDWYRKFCGEHPSSRKDYYRWSKFKTKIKRRWTIRALNELIDGKCGTFTHSQLKSFWGVGPSLKPSAKRNNRPVWRALKMKPRDARRRQTTGAKGIFRLETTKPPVPLWPKKVK